MRIMIPLFIIVLFFCSSCQLGFVNVEDGNMAISIETGSYWLHDYPLWGPIIKKNPPTFAIWLTDENDVYIRTVYASKKVSSANWIANDDSRPESLPQWFRQRGGQPTEENPETDALTSATPRQSFTCTDDSGSLERFKIWFEINHSIDYNQYFTSELFDEDDFQFNGGTGGSGQPAVVYCL